MFSEKTAKAEKLGRVPCCIAGQRESELKKERKWQPIKGLGGGSLDS